MKPVDEHTAAVPASFRALAGDAGDLVFLQPALLVDLLLDLRGLCMVSGLDCLGMGFLQLVVGADDGRSCFGGETRLGFLGVQVWTAAV